jgi:hypothetical protein
MPRGVKGSGKAATVKKGAVSEKVPSAMKVNKAGSATATSADTPAKKARKPYPSADKRIVLADAQIERLTKVNDSRRALIERTEATLNTRKIALAKSTASLEKALGKKERLIATKGKPAKALVPRLSDEGQKARRAESLAMARAAKKAEKEKYDQLLAALKESGKSVDDLLMEINK